MKIKLLFILVITVLVCSWSQAGNMVPEDAERDAGGVIHLKNYPFNPLEGEPLIPENLRDKRNFPYRTRNNSFSF